jgi:site-specific DNA-methyltransferase (adenine-specific)
VSPVVQDWAGARAGLAVHFSSRAHTWETPPEVFAPLDAEFGFTLDAAALPETAKCARYFTPADDALAQDWGRETVWLNPPYGRAIGAFMRKAAASARAGATVVCLVPARTDTAWWHEDVLGARAEVRFVRGRIRFLLDGAPKDAAPFPCAIVIHRPPVCPP